MSCVTIQYRVLYQTHMFGQHMHGILKLVRLNERCETRFVPVANHFFHYLLCQNRNIHYLLIFRQTSYAYHYVVEYLFECFVGLEKGRLCFVL